MDFSRHATRASGTHTYMRKRRLDLNSNINLVELKLQLAEFRILYITINVRGILDSKPRLGIHCQIHQTCNHS